MATPFGLTTDGLEIQIGTNHFGHFLLTDLLLPLLDNASASTPTVVVVSSGAHWDSYPEGIRWTVAEMNDEASCSRTQTYGQSELANVLFAQELAERVKENGILVNCIHPGGVDTELARHFLDLVTKYLGEAASRFFAEHVMPKGGMWTPRDASFTQVFAAVSPSLKAKKVSGKYFHPIARETTPDTPTQSLGHHCRIRCGALSRRCPRCRDLSENGDEAAGRTSFFWNGTNRHKDSIRKHATSRTECDEKCYPIVYGCANDLPPRVACMSYLVFCFEMVIVMAVVDGKW